MKSEAAKPGATTLLSLPPEVHLLISKHLIYPDALSLKHTNRHFYGLVYTGIRLKVEWLIERRSLHLECPNNYRCDLGSDLRFCRGSVPLLMQRRREHLECESRAGLGCLVYGTSKCIHRGTLSTRWKRFMRSRLTLELWWVLLALVPLIFCWIWMLELFEWGSIRPFMSVLHTGRTIHNRVLDVAQSYSRVSSDETHEPS